MCRKYGLRLLLDDISHSRRKCQFQSVSVRLLGSIFTSFAFVQDRLFVLARDCGFDIHPATMQCTRHAAALLRVASHRSHQFLQDARKFGSLLRELIKQRFQLRALYALGR